MVMVTGGAYQGKKAYVTRKFGISESNMTDGASCTFEEAARAVCITNYHELIRRLGVYCKPFTEELCRKNSVAVVIIDEIGCGIIPLEKSERVWRENVGRCGSMIAANSEKVVRIICGIPTFIKGDAE